ncbi:MAG: YidB family protein [Rhodoblastus sp.]
MGILDGLFGQMMGQFEAQVLPGLLQNALAHTSLGSLQGLVDKLRASGLGPQVNSWLGRGANQPITADQLENALGQSVVEKLSTTLNMPPDTIFGFLAKWLPTIIDTLSPNGQMQAPPKA